MNKSVKDECTFCVYLNRNGTCGNKRSVMYNITTNKKEAQLCSNRRYYNREAFKVYRKKRKMQSIYDYE